MTHRVTLLQGDGIGPEICDAVLAVIAASGVKIVWDEQLAGPKALARYNTPLPPVTLQSIKKNRVALKGPITTEVGKGFRSVNVMMRKSLDLYANVRPVLSIPTFKTRYENIDLVVVRENTEDLYMGIEHEVVPGVVEAIKVITQKASERIASYAFAYARTHGRKKVTAVHKANIMKLSDGLFLESCRKIAKRYPDIKFDDKIVDNACMQLVSRPEQFDVLVMENLYGDILSDLASGLIGGLGLTPGSNIGAKAAVFEAVHGSAPDIAGKGISNPIALLLSSCLMLEHLKEVKAAQRIRNAVVTALRERKNWTPDLGGKAKTSQLTQALIKAL